MNARTLLYSLPALALLLLVASTAPARAEGPAPPDVEKVVKKMIEAVKAESYDAFLADADTNLKEHLSRQQFQDTCGRYTQALQKGYTLDYFGQLKQRGMVVYIWKVSVPGESEDALVKLVMKEGKVTGVWVL
jgi:hypothetical protein